MVKLKQPTLTEIKLASIVVHAQELLSVDGREADRQALIPLLNDLDIKKWISQFEPVLLPIKRRK